MRERESIREVIVQFYRDKMASNHRRFWPTELRDYIRDQMGSTPNSIERRLREAREQGAVNYELVSRGHPECEYQVLELDVVREDVRKTPPPEPDEAMKKKAHALLHAARGKKNGLVGELRKAGELTDVVLMAQAVEQALIEGLENQDWKVIAEAIVMVEMLGLVAMRDSWGNEPKRRDV